MFDQLPLEVHDLPVGALPLFAGGNSVTSQSAADDAFAMLHGLYWLLNNLARDRPIALCIDDLQWSDTESLRFLSYLASRLDGLPVAVLATVRTRENVTADVARLSAQVEVRILRLEPLSVEQVIARVAQTGETTGIAQQTLQYAITDVNARRYKRAFNYFSAAYFEAIKYIGESQN